MRTWTGLLLCLVLAGCASAPLSVPPREGLFQDQLFAAPTQHVSADEVFALSDAMTRYLKTDIAHLLHTRGRHNGLVEALYRRGLLKLEYDAAMTRNAAQAFEARAGNCLSLVIMTAAFAKELGLQVHYQSAYLEETWSRSGDLLFRSGHVNLTLGRRMFDVGTSQDMSPLTIDFLPADDIRRMRTRPIPEQTIVAMYMNNRAAEALEQGQLDNAYAWARAAVQHSPAFLSSYNTLGVIYQRHGDLAQAAQVFEVVLEREPQNTRAMSNLADVLARLGRTGEADTLLARLARIEPHPPFHFFNLGMAAMRQDDFTAARDWFAKEVARADYYDEFHFWLGVAHFKLGDVEQARKHLTLAMENSTVRSQHELYAAKLAWLRAHSTP